MFSIHVPLSLHSAEQEETTDLSSPKCQVTRSRPRKNRWNTRINITACHITNWNIIGTLWCFTALGSFQLARSRAIISQCSPRQRLVRASSYEPGYRYLASFQFPLLKFRCVHDMMIIDSMCSYFNVFIRRRASPVTELFLQPGWKFSHMITQARVTGRNFLDKIASLSKHSDQKSIILTVSVL